MAKTIIRGYQIAKPDIIQAHVANGYMDLNTKQSISGAKTFNNAIFGANPVEIASVAGVITLTEASNTFIVSGTEDVTSITGWVQGEVTIIWVSNRRIIHSLDLFLQGSVNRDVIAQDVEKFVFYEDGTVKETGFFAHAPGADASAYVTEEIADEGQTVFEMVTAPADKSFMTVSINGLIQANANFSIATNQLTLVTPCNAGDEVRVFAITRALGYGVGGDFVIDGGQV